MNWSAYSHFEPARRAIAALLLGVWLNCGLLCAVDLPGCDSSPAATGPVGSEACCHRHGSAATRPADAGTQTPSACCDNVTVPSASPGEHSRATIESRGLDAGLPPAVVASPAPSPCAVPPILSNGRFVAVTPADLLGVAHLPLGPPARA